MISETIQKRKGEKEQMERKKFTFIGAGSLGFTRDLVRDILTFDSFRNAEICLMDIDEKRLEY